MRSLFDQSPSSKTTRQAGMTLVEMLLAVTLFSTMMGATGSLLQFGLRSQLTWGGAAAPYMQMERALNGLERDVVCAQQFFGAPAVGAKDHLELARVDRVSVDGAPATPEWVRVVYRVQDDAGPLSLVREEYLWRLGASSAPVTRQRVLSLAAGAFEFGRLDANKQLLWADAWDGAKDGVPKLVRLTCTIPTASGQESMNITRAMRNPSGHLPQDEPTP